MGSSEPGWLEVGGGGKAKKNEGATSLKYNLFMNQETYSSTFTKGEALNGWVSAELWFVQGRLKGEWCVFAGFPLLWAPLCLPVLSLPWANEGTSRIGDVGLGARNPLSKAV